jgi:hypothetical protein
MHVNRPYGRFLVYTMMYIYTEIYTQNLYSACTSRNTHVIEHANCNKASLGGYLVV